MSQSIAAEVRAATTWPSDGSAQFWFDESEVVHVVTADCYDVLPSLPVNTVDCVITSPPYWGLRTYGLDHHTDVLSEWKSMSSSKSVAIQERIVSAPGYDWYRQNGGVLGLEPYPEWFVLHLVEIFKRLRPSLKVSDNLWVNLGDTYFA